VVEGTRLRAIVGRAEIAVNSTHHQAVKAVGENLVVDAVAPDGVIEGIEDPRRRFCIGVQWHPEYRITAADSALFAAFIAACR
jgi:putative glutamine amidotransferase